MIDLRDISTRVYRRTLNNIIILWTIDHLSAEDKEKIDISKLSLSIVDDNDNKKKVVFKKLEFDDFRNLKDEASGKEGIVIDQTVNNIDPYDTINLLFEFQDGIRFKFYVRGHGYQKKEKSETQIMGYVPNERIFRPLEMVKTENGYCVKCVMVKN